MQFLNEFTLNMNFSNMEDDKFVPIRLCSVAVNA